MDNNDNNNLCCACCYRMLETDVIFCKACADLKPNDFDRHKNEALVYMRYMRTGWMPNIHTNRNLVIYFKEKLNISEWPIHHDSPCVSCLSPIRPTFTIAFYSGAHTLCRTCYWVYDTYADKYLTTSKHESDRLEYFGELRATCLVLTILEHKKREGLPLCVEDAIIRKDFIAKFFIIDKYERGLLECSPSDDNKFQRLWDLLCLETNQKTSPHQSFEDFDPTSSLEVMNEYWLRKAAHWSNHFPTHPISSYDGSLLAPLLRDIYYAAEDVVINSKVVDWHVPPPLVDVTPTADQQMDWAYGQLTNVLSQLNEALQKATKVEGIRFGKNDDVVLDSGYTISETYKQGTFVLEKSSFGGAYHTPQEVRLAVLMQQPTSSLSKDEQAIMKVLYAWDTDVSPLLQKVKRWKREIKQALF